MGQQVFFKKKAFWKPDQLRIYSSGQPLFILPGIGSLLYNESQLYLPFSRIVLDFFSL